MSHPWTHNERAATFLGVGMAQRWVDLAIWERVLNSSKWWKGLIELGTGSGSFSTFLFLQCIQRRMTFHTFDNRKVRRGAVAQFLKLDDRFHETDIFEDGKVIVTSLINAPELHPLILFCDDGWKQEEFRVFAPLLRGGDLVAVHDWGTEFDERYLSPMDGRLTPLFFEECEAIESLTRFWKVGAQ